MNRQKQIKTNGKKAAICLTAAAFISVCGAGAGTFTPPGTPGIVAYGAESLPEYDEETLEKFADNTLEYWEIPGLVSQYNAVYRAQLEQYYSNPGGATGLSVSQLRQMAADLREEADKLSKEAEAGKDDESLTKEQYEAYQTDIKALKKYAGDLEKDADGDTAAGKDAMRRLRFTREDETRSVSAMMREYQTLVSQRVIAEKKLELAELSKESALRQQAVGMKSAEDVLAAEEAYNAAAAARRAAESAEKEAREELITALGWSYDASPVICPVPEPDISRLEAMNPEADVEQALIYNRTLAETKRTGHTSLGGADAKARKEKTEEEQVRMAFAGVYEAVRQAKASYEAALTKYQADEADWAAVKRKEAMGLISRQEYLTAEIDWLSAMAQKEKAGLDLTAAIEDYDWAMKGVLTLSAI